MYSTIEGLKTLTPGTFVKAPGFRRAYKFNTVRNYLGDAAHQRAVERGDSIAWTTNAGTMITNDHAYNAQRLATQRAQFDAAVTLQSGELVSIDGELFRVRINGEDFSDPIGFTSRKAEIARECNQPTPHNC